MAIKKILILCILIGNPLLLFEQNIHMANKLKGDRINESPF